MTANGSTPSLNAISSMGGPSPVPNPFPHATMTATNFDDLTYHTNSTSAVRAASQSSECLVLLNALFC